MTGAFTISTPLDRMNPYILQFFTSNAMQVLIRVMHNTTMALFMRNYTLQLLELKFLTKYLEPSTVSSKTCLPH